MAITGTLEDREEVRTLHARYCLTIDTGRYDEWIDCFTEDGVFESPRFGKHSGRDGLRKFTARYKESLGGAQVQQSTVGFYTDKLRKTPAGWRFVSRQVTILGSR